MNRPCLATAAAAAVLASALAPASASTDPTALLNGTLSQCLALNRLASEEVGGTGMEAIGQSVAFSFVIKVNKATPKLMRTR